MYPLVAVVFVFKRRLAGCRWMPARACACSCLHPTIPARALLLCFFSVLWASLLAGLVESM
ncbi:paraflagellar rod protein 2C [Leishmania donovani]|uniref:Paraflagellar rod protein 2C n=1 Tax=Leishmania donovani TaxID=5661 RepID=E9BD04_LEIDO|nr:paraflagellar rod protein 2C [Leishmania donovani]CBZ33130.1 paraflagellar rod protein 2C [Leishmania donovani]